MRWKSEEKLIDYAKELENSTVKETNQRLLENKKLIFKCIPDYSSRQYNGKGRFGEFLEENYFGKENDNASKPDFDEVGVELKAVPLIDKGNGTVVKERIVLNKFRFYDIVKEKFETSHFLEKNAKLLFVFYFHDNLLRSEDKKIDIVELWSVLYHDIEQIRADWQFIVDKINAGQAHELSEGDTLYLGACTKGSTAKASMQIQPYSTIKARGRALCFKISYANMIYKLLSENHKEREKEYAKSIHKGKTWIPLEGKIHQLTDMFIGMSGREIYKHFNKPFNPDNKACYAFAARYMLGLYNKNANYYEFEAANIQIKSIRVEENGNIEQSMSFKNIPFIETANQEWEDSPFYAELTSKFVMMIFRKIHDSDDYYFDGFFLWNMPERDLDKAKMTWEETKELIIKGIYSEFPRAALEGSIAHVRPKGQNNEDLMETPQGTQEKKKCFWLNKKYIKRIVEENFR